PVTMAPGDPQLGRRKECNLAPHFHRVNVAKRPRERAQIAGMREESTVDCLDKVVGPRLPMAAIGMHHPQVKRAVALEAAMPMTAQLPQTIAVIRRNGIVRTPQC